MGRVLDGLMDWNYLKFVPGLGERVVGRDEDAATHWTCMAQRFEAAGMICCFLKPHHGWRYNWNLQHTPLMEAEDAAMGGFVVSGRSISALALSLDFPSALD